MLMILRERAEIKLKSPHFLPNLRSATCRDLTDDFTLLQQLIQSRKE